MARDDTIKTLKQDEVLKYKLREASDTIPRYLFRMWHPGSGGNPKLNTTDAITPHVFLQRPDHDLPVVYDMTAEQFRDNTTKHLCGDRTVLSEFSSWSASTRFVLHYATTQRDSAYVAVIDTARFQKGTVNATFHVPALKPIFGSHKSCQAFNGGRGFDYGKHDWEYLVHGVIKSRHYKAVSFRTLCQQGLIDHLPALRNPVNAWCTERWLLPGPSLLFDAREFSQLQKIAKLFGFGSRFHTVLTITLFCFKKRHFQGASIPRNDRYHVSRTLGNRDDIPYDWSDSHFLQDEVYDARYEGNRQMVNVIKLVHTYCWEQGSSP